MKYHNDIGCNINAHYFQIDSLQDFLEFIVTYLHKNNKGNQTIVIDEEDYQVQVTCELEKSKVAIALNLYTLDEKTCVLEYQKIMGDQLDYQKQLKVFKEKLAELFADEDAKEEEVEAKQAKGEEVKEEEEDEEEEEEEEEEGEEEEEEEKEEE